MRRCRKSSDNWNGSIRSAAGAWRKSGRNADGASLGCRRGVASETGHHQSDRIVLSTVQRVARNVKRWREGDQPLRWTATGLLEAEKKFRRIKGYQEILLPEGTLESVAHSAEGGPDSRSRLNFVVGRLTVPNIESRCNQLKTRTSSNTASYRLRSLSGSCQAGISGCRSSRSLKRRSFWG